MEKLEVISSKIIDREKLPFMLAYWKFLGKKIVFTNGCFDLLHLGHIDYLSKAADQGDILVVGINTDGSVSRLKGPGRPINPEQARARLMASLFFVSAVVLFDEDTPYELIKTIQPDVLIKGSDYKAEEIVGYDIVMQKGGQVITLDFLEGYSTSGIVEKIRKDPDPFTI
jgi:D-glycero-beta-D-manno-heptose 1-phosphate adenylyltransferase